ERFLYETDAGLYGLARPALLLNVHGAQTSGEPLLLHQPADLVDLASQAEHDDGGKIYMPRIAAEGSAKQRQRLILGHAATGLVGERHHPVDIRIVGKWILAGERILFEDVGDETGDMRAAIHRRQDADIVARGHAAIGPANSVKRGREVEI